MTNTQQGAESAGEKDIKDNQQPKYFEWVPEEDWDYDSPVPIEWIRTLNSRYLRPVPSASVEGKESYNEAAYNNLRLAVQSFLEIGKRDLSNPKYDGYFNTLMMALASSPAPAQVENPYPESVFPEPSDAEWSSLAKVLESKSFNMDKYFGAFGRKVWDNAIKSITNDNETNS